ncbi:MAG: hypothetical protein PF517_16800 [Salinivirgaceae bacterium]|jgi:hypothetical protein|nr:hypothetical protein [Salinivirgaceae bacterium]
MSNIQITVTVKVSQLKALMPEGGIIPDGDIITMIQNGGGFEYETATKAKLITKAAIGSKIKWKIKSDDSTHLDFVSYEGDAEENNVYDSLPAVDSNKKNECDATVKSKQPTQNYKTNYTFFFCDKKNPNVVWKWDPIVNIPWPPI